jgi:hypothetical protein
MSEIVPCDWQDTKINNVIHKTQIFMQHNFASTTTSLSTCSQHRIKMPLKVYCFHTFSTFANYFPAVAFSAVLFVPKFVS